MTTNLLPSEEKKSLRANEFWRMIRFFGAGLASIFLIGTIALLPAYFFSRVQTAVLRQSLQSEEEAATRIHLHETIAAIRGNTDALARVGAFAPDAGRASVIMDNFLHPPSGISIGQIMVKKDGAVGVSGTALTRASLLTFEGALRDAGWFENVSIPLSSIIQESNIRFTVQGVLKLGRRL